MTASHRIDTFGERIVHHAGIWLIVTALLFMLPVIAAVVEPLVAGLAVSVLVGSLMIAGGITHIISVVRRDDGGGVWHDARHRGAERRTADSSLAARETGGERGSFVGERRGKHEVAVAQRLLRLLHEALRLVVLRAGVGVQPAVVHSRECAGGAGQRIARLAFSGGIRCG